MENEILIPCSKQPSARSFSEPHYPSPYPDILFLSSTFLILSSLLRLYPRSSLIPLRLEDTASRCLQMDVFKLK